MNCKIKDFEVKEVTEGGRDGIKIKINGEEVGILKGKVSLIPEKDIKNYKIEDFSSLWLYEFENYEFEGKNGWELRKIGESEIIREDKNIKIQQTRDYPFKNYIGKSEIIFKFKKEEKEYSLPVEVISEKLETNKDSPLFYPRFYKNLILSIWEKFKELPFDIAPVVFTPTSYYISLRASPLFTFFFLKNNKENLKSALNTIRANPYRILKEEKEMLDINKVSEVDADTIYSILTNPEYLYESKSKLGFSAKEKYYLPKKVLSSLKYETLDTPENRFVLNFLKRISQDIEELIKSNKEYKETVIKEIEGIKGLIDDFIKDPLWEEVGEFYIFPSYSTVLRKREGYKELLELYFKYLMGRSPFEKIEEAINLRKVYELYEFFCALKLCSLLNGTKGKIVMEVEEKIKGKLKIKLEFMIGNKNYKFIYQKNEKSYSGISLIPDFSIYEGKKLRIILDAKFAFKKPDIDKEKDKENIGEEIEREWEEGKVPKTGDIIKMHAYKDALKADACIILYPGEEDKFYKEEGDTPFEGDLKNLIEKILTENEEKKENLKGIGWFKMLPYEE
ncbi:MAG: DUF2357 domain-containing protein [candidate division WOR-3 bacterium]